MPCSKNEHVQSNECVSCDGNSFRAAGDFLKGGDTSCTTCSDFEARGAVTWLTLSQGSCPGASYKVPTSAHLNGDLNQGAGGKTIHLCEERSSSGRPIAEAKVVQYWQDCGSGWDYVSGDGIGDLNGGAGGDYVYLCIKYADQNEDYSRGWSFLPPPAFAGFSLVGGTTSQGGKNMDCGDGPKIQGISPSRVDVTTAKTGGDLNSGAGGAWIYLCAARLPSCGA